MNAIEFLSNPGASCGGVDVDELMRERAKLKAMEAGMRKAAEQWKAMEGKKPQTPVKGIEGIAPAVDWDATMKRVTEHLEEVMEGMPERPGFWARVWSAIWRRWDNTVADDVAAALRRRLVARDEQIEVLKRRVAEVIEDRNAARSARLKNAMQMQILTLTIERLEPVTIRHRNRAAHYERRFVELHAELEKTQAELAEVREALAVSELARREMIAE